MEKFKVEHPDLNSDINSEPKTHEQPDEQKPNIQDPEEQKPNIKDPDEQNPKINDPDKLNPDIHDPNELKPRIEDPNEHPVPDIKGNEIELMGEEKPVNHPDQQLPLNKTEGSE